MIDLIKFELYKIFSKKSVIALMIVSFLFVGYQVIGEQIALKLSGLDNFDNVYDIVKEYEGKEITEEDIVKLNTTIDKLKEKEKSGETLSKKEEVYRYYLYDNLMEINPTYSVNGERYKLDEMKNEIDKLKKENKTDSYEYENLTYVYDLVSKKESPKYYFKYSWMQPTNFNVIATLITTIIAVGIATIFSDEYQSNSAQMVLSCRNGKNKLVLAKILSGLLFTTIAFVLINGTCMISVLTDGFRNIDLPLNFFSSYEATPFDMSMGEFYIKALGVSFMGAILYTLVITLISLIVKNNMVAVLLGLAMYYVPPFVAGFIPSGGIAKIFSQINLAEAVRIQGMFRYTETYNVFGNPTLYSTVLMTCVLVAIPVVTYLIKYLGKKQTI